MENEGRTPPTDPLPTPHVVLPPSILGQHINPYEQPSTQPQVIGRYGRECHPCHSLWVTDIEEKCQITDSLPPLLKQMGLPRGKS